MTAIHRFQIPDYLNASSPVEYRRGKRENVRLFVLDRKRERTFHSLFTQLVSFLSPGDLLVLNNSRTIPSVLKGRLDGKNIEVRLSRRLSDDEWEVLIIGGKCSIGNVIEFPAGLTARITEMKKNSPLSKLAFSKESLELYHIIYQYGEPIRYEYIDHPWPLDAYQNVYASVPGSVEMPSAGRALSWKMLNMLKRYGIQIAYLQLHAGLSYYGQNRWPVANEHPEHFHIPAVTADLVNKTKKNNNRVIAVGTTVVRALESSVDGCGKVEPQDNITKLNIQKSYSLKVVDGLLTGFHEPEASHLDLLSAFIDENFLIQAYREAIDMGYLWHEFGDMNLIIPILEQC
ncbi:S-adenosylmethionine:tRNA ribosyltransferase-isomerase [Bacillus aquiflavi]|uniref:S-adenosylmethionine:tRNA ribosyltransferase-isomerase n=1 Tax=Bacillus aquiflavi TaxID=2672567 RepID=A0A6B3W5M1_9BACI|nr:S-adenosylmethionine:tRNA ribosyltransferase-isomerase [Bacillus aquiflavi]MBA4538681.1 S-adenosylmethionine:tRNA ribosyltransferase-isomerase [Bacillus aquiflavi]NEY83041.1 S-adenosylmethionine:tRNA ribosyltransferase-isomerase [Bacillus aquiflavi]UAC48014.1 S-adenosylmethionine:tRNA ribosyltransferase-isomerase [Bacillus aquiflavi]